jgi:hypothetical protein
MSNALLIFPVSVRSMRHASAFRREYILGRPSVQHRTLPLAETLHWAIASRAAFQAQARAAALRMIGTTQTTRLADEADTTQTGEPL